MAWPACLSYIHYGCYIWPTRKNHNSNVCRWGCRYILHQMFHSCLPYRYESASESILVLCSSIRGTQHVCVHVQPMCFLQHHSWLRSAVDLAIGLSGRCGSICSVTTHSPICITIVKIILNKFRQSNPVPCCIVSLCDCIYLLIYWRLILIVQLTAQCHLRAFHKFKSQVEYKSNHTGG